MVTAGAQGFVPGPLCKGGPGAKQEVSMSWYTLHAEGTGTSAMEGTQLNLVSSCPSLEQTTCRLRDAMEDRIDSLSGTFPNGLRAALRVQLTVLQWRSWSDFRAVETALGGFYPTMRAYSRW